VPLAIASAAIAAWVLLWPSAEPASAAGVVAVAAGGNHTCALTTAGGVICWGENEFGQLGDGSTTDRTTPVAVPGLTSGVAAIAAGGNHTCALTTGGGVKCWGSNRYGQLGSGTTSGLFPNPSPVDVVGLDSGVAAIVAGGVHTCVLTSAGGVKCWGWNRYGQVGDGQACSTICSRPVDVSGLASGAVALAGGGSHSCALTTGGGLKCWGSDALGQVGAQTADMCTDPLLEQHPCSLTPVDVADLGSGVAAVDAGGDHTCALTSGGAPTCWGDNGSGQVGDGGACGAVCGTPVDVSGLDSGVAAVAAGRAHTCALVEGAAKCWGDNAFGQLGDNLKPADRGTPGDVCANEACPIACITEPCETVLAATALALGSDHACALLAAGGVRCWGRNSSGQLGDGTTEQRSAPVDVLGLKPGTPTATPTRTHTPTPTRTPTPSVARGDASCDGNVNSIDAALVLQYIARVLTSLRCAAAADVNGDGRIDAVDAALILQYDAGLLTGPFDSAQGKL